MSVTQATGSGIQFAGDGPMMTGTWINPQTGHKFTVKDCYFQDGQFMVQTTDGQMLDYNTVQNYIQCNDNSGNPIEPNIQPVKENKSINNIPDSVAAELEDEMTSEDRAMAGLGSINNSPTINQPIINERPTQPIEATPKSDPDMEMVERVLRKHSIPKIMAEIVWEKCPKKQIETLVDVLGIDPETISKYYINKLDREAIFDYITDALNKYIYSLNSTDSTQNPPKESKSETPVSTKTPRGKRTNKTTTK